MGHIFKATPEEQESVSLWYDALASAQGHDCASEALCGRLRLPWTPLNAELALQTLIGAPPTTTAGRTPHVPTHKTVRISQSDYAWVPLEDPRSACPHFRPRTPCDCAFQPATASSPPKVSP